MSTEYLIVTDTLFQKHGHAHPLTESVPGDGNPGYADGVQKCRSRLRHILHHPRGHHLHTLLVHSRKYPASC